MQPGRKCRLATEGRNLAVELQERFLREVFGLGRIGRHPQTERIDAQLVPVVEGLERFSVPLFGPFDRVGFAKFVDLLLSSVGQVAFSGRYRIRCGITIFMLYGLRVADGIKHSPEPSEYQSISTDLGIRVSANSSAEILCL